MTWDRWTIHPRRAAIRHAAYEGRRFAYLLAFIVPVAGELRKAEAMSHADSMHAPLGQLFVNPAFAWAALVLAAIPIVIYILNRRRFRIVPWAAMIFLLSANRKTLRRSRLEQLLLLVLRVCLVGIFSLALARPYLQPGHLPELLTQKAHHLILLDNSHSMLATIATHSKEEGSQVPQDVHVQSDHSTSNHGGVESDAAGRGSSAAEAIATSANRVDAGVPDASRQSAFEAQIAAAVQLISQIPAGDPISIVTMGRPARLLNDQPIHDPTVATHLIERIKPNHTQSDLMHALQWVRDRLMDSKPDDAKWVVHAFSDWNEGLFGSDLGRTDHRADQRVTHADDRRAVDVRTSESVGDLMRQIENSASVVLYAARDGSPFNVAVSGLSIDPTPLGVDPVCHLRCRLTNCTERRSPEGVLHIFQDGGQIAETRISPLDGQASIELTHTVALRAEGSHVFEATLSMPGDMLELDNHRRLCVESRDSVSVLLVDGAPGITMIQGQAGYLRMALAPVEEATVQPTIITEYELQTHDLRPYDVIYLCNVRRLPDGFEQRIMPLLGEGKSLVMYLGHLVDQDNYNQQASALLPATLSGLGLDVGEEDDAQFDPETLQDPLKSLFAGRQRSGLFTARVWQYVRFGRQGASMPGQVLLSYRNQDAAITERRIGNGRCIVVGTTANMDWNNLAARGDFVTLNMGLLHYATPDPAAHRNLIAGDAFVTSEARTPSHIRSDVRVQDPSGAESVMDIRSDGQLYHHVYDQTLQAGWYFFLDHDASIPLAVNPHPAEGDLRHVSQEQLQERLDCSFQWRPIATSVEEDWAYQEDELSLLMIYAVLLLLMFETLLAVWFGHQS